MPDTLKGEFVLNKEEKAENAPVTKTASTNGTGHNHTHTSAGIFSSLCEYPHNISFKHQDEDEEVVLLIRRDFITNLPWIISILLLSLFPPVFLILGPIFFPFISVSGILLISIIIFYYLALFGFALLYYAVWYFNVGLVTNKRIIDLDVPNILVNETSEAALESIADVSFTQVGSIRSIFNYGDVFVQTEAIRNNLEFDRAPEPNLIRKIIGDLAVRNK